MKHIIFIFVLLALASCGDKATQPDPAYFGTWEATSDDDAWLRLTVCADTLVSLNSSGEGYTLSKLIWEPMTEPTGKYREYQTGYKITGELSDVTDGYLYDLIIPDGDLQNRLASMVLYMSTHGGYFVRGDKFSPHGAYPDITFDKQPEVPVTEAAARYTVEDTVRLQLGGKLYFSGDRELNIASSDSITVFHRRYLPTEDDPRTGELYREYGFIVHSRDHVTHRTFEPRSLDASYSRWKKSGYYSWLDSVRTEHLAPEIADFNGYWIPLTEHDGDYYLDDYMGDLGTFHIADSIITRPSMDGLNEYKIRKATALPDGGVAIEYSDDNPHLDDTYTIKPFDREREVYRYQDSYFITPARAIHNFEVIVWANNTGDLI